jgi:nucleotide-binding universal stress UspA family protein
LESEIIMQDVLARAVGESTLAGAVAEPKVVRRILCATDLTDRSWPAERRAALLAQQMSAEVLFVHAMPIAQPRRIRRMAFARAHAMLLSRADNALADLSQEARTSVRHATAVQAIIGAASDWQPDLIVMARPKLRARDLVLGTTAERVIRATRRPVLLVNATADRNYRSVLLAADMSDVSVHAAQTLVSMKMLEQASAAWIVHAFQPPYYGLLRPHRLEATAYRRQWQGLLSAELLQRMSVTGMDLARTDVVVELARPLEAIHKWLQRSRPELLVIGTSRWFMLKRLIFGSVADQVLRRAECDVLAIPPPARASSTGAAIDSSGGRNCK